MRPSTIRSAIALIAVLSLSSSALAQDDASGDTPSWGYLVDGRAVPFVWGAGLLAAGSYFIGPPDKPRFFPDSEGGKDGLGDELPDFSLFIFAVASATVVGIPDRQARYFHLKGISQAIVTSAALANFAKHFVGRHRPSYDPVTDDVGERKSFFSGHASTSLSTTIYLGTYLHSHVFSEWRGDRSFAWWETFPLAALAGVAFYTPYTRVRDNRHHLSDVLVGGIVGATAATGFYIYQERRFQNALDRESTARSNVSLTPSFGPRVLSLSGTF